MKNRSNAILPTILETREQSKKDLKDVINYSLSNLRSSTLELRNPAALSKNLLNNLQSIESYGTASKEMSVQHDNASQYSREDRN